MSDGKYTYKHYSYQIRDDYVVSQNGKNKTFDCTNIWIFVKPYQKGYVREQHWLTKYLKPMLPKNFSMELMDWKKTYSFCKKIKYWYDNTDEVNTKTIFLTTKSKLSDTYITKLIHAIINNLLALAPLILPKKKRSKTMSFSKALIYMKFGYTIKRKSWSKHHAIFMPLGLNDYDTSIETADCQYAVDKDKMIINDSYLPAYLSAPDILADDWIVVNHKHNQGLPKDDD